MANTSATRRLPERDVNYYRQRQKNRVFQQLVAFFAGEAELRGVSKRDLAEMLDRDPAQITRWLSYPTNLTLDTVSDLLLALGAEMDHQIVRFADRERDETLTHPLISSLSAKPKRIAAKASKNPPLAATPSAADNLAEPEVLCWRNREDASDRSGRSTTRESLTLRPQWAAA